MITFRFRFRESLKGWRNIINQDQENINMQRTLLIACVLFLFGISAFAQNNSILRGQLTDQNSDAVPGVTVTITGNQLQGNKTAVTDEGGNFSFLGLAPGTYQVDASKTGFKPLKQENVILRASQTLDLNLSLQVGEATGTVEVRAGEDAPIVDTSNPEKNYNISGEFITQLPLNSRQSWEALWTMVPGVGNFPDGANYDPVVNGAGNLGSGAASSQGVVSTVSNSYTLNGFNIGNSFTNQGWRTQFSTEAIQDVVVKTAGADASTPLAQGGAVDVITKSGSNKYHGSIGIFSQPRKFNWTNVPGGTSSTLTLFQPDFSFGGPVILPGFGEGVPTIWKGKDKLWFFTTYRNVVTNEGVARSAAVLARFAQYGFPVPDYDKLERSQRITGKVSYQATKKHSFVFNYLNDKGTIFNSDSNDASTLESTIDINEGGPTYQISWAGNLTSRLFWTAQYGKRNVNNDIKAKGGDRPSRVLWESTVISGGNRVGSGNVLLYYDNRTGNAAASIGRRPHEEFTTDLTWLTRFFGGHTIQAGFLLRPATEIVSRTTVPSSGTTVIDEVLIGTTRVPFRRFTWDSANFSESTRSTDQRGFYVQDKWKVNSRLSVNFGGRFDNQRSTDILGRTLFDAWTFNPRLGVAYSLNKEGRDVIRGSWGRYSDLLTINATPSLPGTLNAPGFRNEYDNDLNGSFETVVITAGTTTSTTQTGLNFQEIDPNLSVSYKDEFQVGYTRQLPFKMVLDAGYVQSEFKNIIGTFNRNWIFTNGFFTGLNDPNYNNITVRTNLSNFKQKYQSFQLSLIRNIGARYSFFANYTYQKRTLKGDFATDDPQLYLNPSGYFNDSKQVKPFLIALNGDARLPWGFKASAIYTIEAGNYGGYLTKILATTDPEFTRHPATITVTLPGGGTRSVSNPLRSTTRLLNARNDGRLQLPTRYKLNLRLGKNFKLPWEGQQIESAVDIFNVFNESTPLGFANSTRPDLATFGTYSSFVGSPRGIQMSLRYRF